MSNQYEQNDCIDLESGLARIRGNKKLYARMLGMFLAGEEANQLEAALAAGDFEEASKAAHAIKGVSGNLSLTRLFETSTELMNELRSGAPSDTALTAYRAAFEQTKVCVTELIDSLNAELS